MFHILGMNLALALAAGHVAMAVSDLEVVRADRHSCAAVGCLTNFFCLATASLSFVQAHAVFASITAGVVGGRTWSYLCLGWGVPAAGLGANVYWHLLQMGDDPRCMLGWAPGVKQAFFLPVISLAGAGLMVVAVALCNVHTHSLRQQSFVPDQSSLAKGSFGFSVVFALTWSWAPLSYAEASGSDGGTLALGFYPAFQVMNSWMGVFYFGMVVAAGSRRFQALLTSHAKQVAPAALSVSPYCS